MDVFFDSDELQLALSGLQRYRPFLEQMRGIEVRFRLERSPVTQEIEKLDRMVAYCNKVLAELAKGTHGFYSITYGSLRWLKAGMLFEIAALKKERDQCVSQRGVMPRIVLESINSKIASLENLAEQGIFNGLVPIQLVVASAEPVPLRIEVADSMHHDVSSPSCVMRVELMDPELLRRCGDLYEKFADSPEHQDRFDTVLREASTVLEDRIREVSGLAQNLIGLDLVSRALASNTGELIISDEPSEQEGGHALFRGFFGLVRNTVAHNIVPAYTKERAAQVLALADYLLFLLSRARRRHPPTAKVAPTP